MIVSDCGRCVTSKRRIWQRVRSRWPFVTRTFRSFQRDKTNTFRPSGPALLAVVVPLLVSVTTHATHIVGHTHTHTHARVSDGQNRKIEKKGERDSSELYSRRTDYGSVFTALLSPPLFLEVFRIENSFSLCEHYLYSKQIVHWSTASSALPNKHDRVEFRHVNVANKTDTFI